MQQKNTYCNRFSLSLYFWSFSLHNIYEYNLDRFVNSIILDGRK